MNGKTHPAHSFSKLNRLIGLIALLVVMATGLMGFVVYGMIYGWPDLVSYAEKPPAKSRKIQPDSLLLNVWTAPSDWRMSRLDPSQRALIEYGRELIAHTADYLGPKGSVRAISNGMNCQNCHLKAGTQPWGNNYFAVQATYPKFRERSGTIEHQVKRISDCFERSLNGQAPDSSSREMRAILAYIKWLGSDVPDHTTPKGSGIYKLRFLNRAADPTKGRLVYAQKCQRCHQPDGSGMLVKGGKSYLYPPLWGKYSYNVGAGLYRISTFAGYVKHNMPFGVTYASPQLSDEQAWDVAAFVNSQPRPNKDLRNDWPNMAGKPIDHPFGPYADTFPEKQHKYGPFGPIKVWKEQHTHPKVSKRTIATR